MPVTAADVREFRAELPASLDGVGPLLLKTYAEQIAYTFTEMRSTGLDEADVLDRVELILRAAQVDREGLYEARDLLRQLGYSASLIKLLGVLARKAKSRSADFPARMRDRLRLRVVDRAPVVDRPLSLRPIGEGEAARALELLRPRPKDRR